MPAIINAPSSAWFVLRDLAEGSDPKAPFFRAYMNRRIQTELPNSEAIRSFYESLGPATNQLSMSNFDPNTYPLGEGWAESLTDNAWNAIVTAAELLNSRWSLGGAPGTIQGGALYALSNLLERLFKPAFPGVPQALLPDFISPTIERAVSRYTSLNEQNTPPMTAFSFVRPWRGSLDPLLEYNFLPDRHHTVIIGAQSETNPFHAVSSTKTNNLVGSLMKILLPDKPIQWGYSAPINWWPALLTSETISVANVISAYPNPSSLLGVEGFQVTWLDLKNTPAIGPRSYPKQARRLLTARWHHHTHDIDYINDALDALNTLGGGDTAFARSSSAPTDEDVLKLIGTMGIYPPIFAAPFDIKYKIALKAKELRERKTDTLDTIEEQGKLVTLVAVLLALHIPAVAVEAVGAAIIAMMVGNRASDVAADVKAMFSEVADMLFLAADPQAAINDTIGFLFGALLVFFRRSTRLVEDHAKLFGRPKEEIAPTVDELCRTTLGLTELQLEQMIRSLGSTSGQLLTGEIGRLSEGDWGYPIRMDRVLADIFTITSNPTRSDLIYPVYCIQPDLLSLPFKKSFEPLTFISTWVTPASKKSASGSVLRITSKSYASNSTIDTAIKDPTLQFVQTVNLASLLLECGFEAEGFTGILSRFMASNGSLGFYLRSFLGDKIGFPDVNSMLNGHSISTVVRYLWRQRITDEFLAYYIKVFRADPDFESWTDQRNSGEVLWALIPWMGTLTRRQAIHSVLGELDLSLDSATGYRASEGSILYRLGGSGDDEATGTAFERWGELSTEDRDSFQLFMREMALCDQELITLAQKLRATRDQDELPTFFQLKDMRNFRAEIAEPDEAAHQFPDRKNTKPSTVITPEQLLSLAFSVGPSGRTK